jgi:hypothetical protein
MVLLKENKQMSPLQRRTMAAVAAASPSRQKSRKSVFDSDTKFSSDDDVSQEGDR